jgi:NADH:ubiquinone oxidoreductase subunit K
MTLSALNVFLILVICLFTVGLYGLLITRNLIKMVVILQILVKPAILAFILAGHLRGQHNLGQSLALTVIVADTIVAVLALSLAVQVRKHFGTLDLKHLNTLRR